MKIPQITPDWKTEIYTGQPKGEKERNMMKYEEFVSIMDEEFNYNLDFKSWDREEFLLFCRDFNDGKTEYRPDEYLTKLYKSLIYKEKEIA